MDITNGLRSSWSMVVNRRSLWSYITITGDKFKQWQFRLALELLQMTVSLNGDMWRLPEWTWPLHSHCLQLFGEVNWTSEKKNAVQIFNGIGFRAQSTLPQSNKRRNRAWWLRRVHVRGSGEWGDWKWLVLRVRVKEGRKMCSFNKSGWAVFHLSGMKHPPLAPVGKHDAPGDDALYQYSTHPPITTIKQRP